MDCRPLSTQLVAICSLFVITACSSEQAETSQTTSPKAQVSTYTPAHGDRLIDASIGDATNLIPMIAGDATSHEALRAGALENSVGTDAIVKLYHGKTNADKSVKEIFALAVSGDEIANEIVSEIGFGMARAIAAITSIIDPEKVIMGGSIGSQDILIKALKRN